MSDVSCRLIAEVVCEYYGVPLRDLMSRRRPRHISKPRHVAMWIARHKTEKSLPEIGQHLGGRDHTTVINSVKLIDELRDTDPAFATELKEIELALEVSMRAVLKLRFNGLKDINAAEVARRVLETPLAEFSISVEEIRALALAAVLTEPTVEEKQEAEPPGSALKRKAEEVNRAHNKFQSARFSQAERGARERLEMTIIELGNQLKKETRHVTSKH